ncbi:DUF202 domain-containing protein [Microbacterium sp. ET2]|uniref:DUF202 domain-containing protein n=1 Tax=Microbacterium albipurpureum TaxID=3050384 RepID=UPI00259D0548|nr:DUF202 domain-containing protein [Microbacterium sp. ET2 (Ac-2212)]WJL94534.1 DUF202 domain-containing protein [Microbacterium sp. ET2 (Ac-2212)]
MSALFDPGLQPERTELAWRRTALAFGIGSIVAMRLIPAVFGSAWWVLVGVAGLITAGALWVFAQRRYRAVNVVLRRDGDRGRMPGGGLLLALALCAVGAGLLSLAVVLVVALARG